MNYNRIYEYRFQKIDRQKKNIVWSAFAAFMYKRLGEPQNVLDPAAGFCEFINLVPSSEKWASDLNEDFIEQQAAKNVTIVAGDVLQIRFLPRSFRGRLLITTKK